MAFKGGRLLEATIATKALSTFIDTMDINWDVDQFDVTAGTAAYKSYISGLAGAKFTISGSWDPTVTTGPASVLFGQITLNQAGTVTAVVLYPAGNNAGQGTSVTGNCLLANYAESTGVGQQVKFSASLTFTGVPTVAQL